MRKKRTHRIICEMLESRRLLSATAPSPHIWFLQNSGSVTDTDTLSEPLQWTTTIPLHLNAVYEALDTSGTYPADPITGISDDNSTDTEAETSRIQSSFQWNFGDGSAIETGFNVAHVFSASGTSHTIKLTITNPAGYSNYTSFKVQVSVHEYANAYYVADAAWPAAAMAMDSSNFFAMKKYLGKQEFYTLTKLGN